MKVKHIITTCGIILGGVAATSGASAMVTYKDSADVQFTFSPVLSMTLVGDGFTIEDLVPGTSNMSNDVRATVSTNNPAGYRLLATVGNATYNTTALVSASGQTLNMIGESATTLSKGTWGYTVDDGVTYGALSTTEPHLLDSTTAASDGRTTAIKIGAYADDGQFPGTYNNVVNFSVVSNISTHTVSVVAGDHVTSVSPSVSASYDEGYNLNISAECEEPGYTFSNWVKSNDYGVIANPASASTTYTVGVNGTTLTAYCVAE